MSLRGKVLLTGGAGYIGSHTAVELLDAGYDVWMIDNASIGVAAVLNGITAASKTGQARANFMNVDLCSEEALSQFFALHTREPFLAVLHLAGLKAVGESVKEPLRYYRNNLIGTLNLLAQMEKSGCKRIIFSSSACVYGDPKSLPIKESDPISPTNPYGHTKAQIEQILKDMCASNQGWMATSLRYQNPIGAHPSGKLGESTTTSPNNVAPIICEVAVGKRPHLSIFGGDWKTRDGTGERDYIHIVDLAQAHLAALNGKPNGMLFQKPNSFMAYNIGTGKGTTVKELLLYFSKAAGKDLPFKIEGKRAGDVARVVADPSIAKGALGFSCKLSVELAVYHALKWTSAQSNK